MVGVMFVVGGLWLPSGYGCFVVVAVCLLVSSI